MAPMGPGTYGSQKGRPKKGGKDAASMAIKTMALLKKKKKK
nr:hypothetical protein [uncultured Mediterranean phage uvMED]|tara:strand:- start:1316 stop:1438 length:123 start_codon:yes stop_codon:yes gene_type:complete